jgi:hypothetical protein
VSLLFPLLYTDLGRDLLHTAPLGVHFWALAFALAPIPLLGSELTKLALRHRACRMRGSPVPPAS